MEGVCMCESVHVIAAMSEAERGEARGTVHTTFVLVHSSFSIPPTFGSEKDSSTHFWKRKVWKLELPVSRVDVVRAVRAHFQLRWVSSPSSNPTSAIPG